MADDLATLAAGWFDTLAERLRLSGRLVMAEARLAVTTFMLMIFLGMLAAGAAMYAWAFLILALGQTLALSGLELAHAWGLLCLLHIGLAWVLWRFVSRISRHLEFVGTRRLLESPDA